MWDALCLNGSVATMAQASPCGFGLIENGAIAIEGDRIAWVGRAAELGANPGRLARRILSLDGRVATPGLIDPHTHVVYCGSRWKEFMMKTSRGACSFPADETGLMWTVRQTRAATDETLLAQALTRVRALLAEGVSTLEIKTGYGLDLDTEVRMARVSRAIGRCLPVTVRSTFLGAHALPPEYAGRADEYLEFLCGTVLARLARLELVDAVDIFCDERGFGHEQLKRLFREADALGLAKYAHADQYARFGAGGLAADEGARAVAHLEHACPSTAAALARSGAVAVLLPGVTWVQDIRSRPPVEALRDHGVPMALATNSNPGSSPCTSPTAIMNMACRLFGLTAPEALAGFTRSAARALGLENCCGTLAPGLLADVAVWNAEHPAELTSHIGGGLCHAVMKSGKVVHVNRAPCPGLDEIMS